VCVARRASFEMSALNSASRDRAREPRSLPALHNFFTPISEYKHCRRRRSADEPWRPGNGRLLGLVPGCVDKSRPVWIPLRIDEWTFSAYTSRSTPTVGG